MEITWRVTSGEGEGEKGGKGTGNKQREWQVENRQGKGKNSTGNGEAKELTCMTHGYELKGQEFRWEEVCGAEGNKGGEMGQL